MSKQIDNLLMHTGDIALRRRAKWILEKIDSRNPKSILDVGCGDGFYLHLLSSLYPLAKVIGVDFDTNALNSARINLKGRKVILRQGDVCKLDFKDNSFDVVLASEVFEHLESDTRGIKEVYRVLKPGGLLLVSVPHSNYPLLWDPVNWLLKNLFNTHIKQGFWAGIWNQHVRLYSKDQLENLLIKGGFKEIKLDTLTHICLPFNHHLLNIFARILARGVGSLRKSDLSKFKGEKNKKKLSPFWLIFKFDKLNDFFKSRNVGVSVVASANKK